MKGSGKWYFTLSPDARYSIYKTYSYEWSVNNSHTVTKEYKCTRRILGNGLCGIRKVLSYDSSLSEWNNVRNEINVFSHDSRLLATDGNPNITIMKVPECTTLCLLNKNDLGIKGNLTMGFTKDCRKLIAASDVGKGMAIRLWNLEDKKLFYACNFAASARNWIFTFSRDSLKLATGSSDGKIRIFDTRTTITPRAWFHAEKWSVEVDDTVHFIDESEGKSKNWLWDFGDGHWSTHQNGANIYRKPGIYTVSLIISNGYVKDTLVRHNYIRVIKKTDVGIDQAVKESIILAPNPVYDHFVIQTSPGAAFKPGAEIGIFNILGKCVMSVEAAPSPVQRIDVSKLAPGIYYVRCGDISRKFVKK